MKNNFLVYTVILAALFAGVTYAAGSSLWGDIDVPDEAPKIPDTTATNLTPAQQKTTCDVLRQKADLSDSLNTPQVQEALRSLAIPDEYKALLSNPASANQLYKQYRQQYLKKNCVN